MGYLSFNSARTIYKIGFAHRHHINDQMRSAIAVALNDTYVAISSKVFDFGLDKPVQFAGNTESGPIQSDQLPTHVVALRVGARDVIVMLYSTGDSYVAVLGASFQTSAALSRYLNYNMFSHDWLGDGMTCETVGALTNLYADEVNGCIGGVDIDLLVATVHSNRGYADRDARPRCLNDLIDGRAANRLSQMENMVAQARFDRVMCQAAPSGLDLMAA